VPSGDHSTPDRSRRLDAHHEVELGSSKVRQQRARRCHGQPELDVGLLAGVVAQHLRVVVDGGGVDHALGSREAMPLSSSGVPGRPLLVFVRGEPGSAAQPTFESPRRGSRQTRCVLVEDPAICAAFTMISIGRSPPPGVPDPEPLPGRPGAG
jgi:hypothetical protein